MSKRSYEKSKTPLWDLYEIIDGWYHEQTRHHLVDIDKHVLENLLIKLGKREESLMLSEAQRIGAEAIGSDVIPNISNPDLMVIQSGQNRLRKAQRQRLSELTRVSK